MCISPTRLPDGIDVACRNCWQCRSNRVNDFVGRSIAESKSAVATHSVTLTYGRDDENSPDHPRAKVLTYSDVQKWLKRLRIEGYPVRYLVAGEYGSEKGRAHWHILMFWQKRVPDVTLDRRIHGQAFWDHGFSYFEIPQTVASFRYVCKYVLKSQHDALNQSHFQMSKTPPLGTKYFEHVAGEYVRQGLAPQDLTYRFPEAKRKNGLPFEFKLQGRAIDYFLQSFLDQWRENYGDRHPPASDVLEEWADTQVSDPTDIVGSAHRSYVSRPKEHQLLSYMADFSRIVYDQRTGQYTLDGKNKLYSRKLHVDAIIDQALTFNEPLNLYSFNDPKTGNVLHWGKNPKGDYQWQGVVGLGGSRRPFKPQ